MIRSRINCIMKAKLVKMTKLFAAYILIIFGADVTENKNKYKMYCDIKIL